MPAALPFRLPVLVPSGKVSTRIDPAERPPASHLPLSPRLQAEPRSAPSPGPLRDGPDQPGCSCFFPDGASLSSLCSLLGGRSPFSFRRCVAAAASVCRAHVARPDPPGGVVEAGTGPTERLCGSGRWVGGGRVRRCRVHECGMLLGLTAVAAAAE